MRKEEIVSKGAYTGYQYPQLVSAKQYIIFSKKGRKYLLLRMSNDRNETVTAFSLKIKQLDVKGNVITTDTHTFNCLKEEALSVFALDREIEICGECVDFTVEPVYAKYGEYTYTLNDGELIATYEAADDSAPVNKEQIRKRFGGESNNIVSRTLKAPKMIFFSMMAALIVIALFSYAQLKYYMSITEVFTLDNVEYTFLTEDRESGPIGIISYKGKAGNIIIPDEIEGHKVGRIAEDAFADSRIVSVVIEGDPVVGKGAFRNCVFLKTASLDKVTFLHSEVFIGCESLTEVTLSSKLKELSASTFRGCSSLEEIALPSYLEILGDRVFEECTNLKKISIPDTVTSIGTEVFRNCRSIETLKTPFFSKNENATINDLIPSSFRTVKSVTVTKITSVSDSAFAYCKELEALSLPDGVTSIGAEAFIGCEKLSSFTIPRSVVEIGEGAFKNCAALTEVNVPLNVSVLNSYVFSGCTTLANVSLPNSLIKICEGAFENCSSISGLVVPINVSSIEKKSFAGCEGMKDLTVSFIGEDVHSPCTVEELFGTDKISLENVRIRGAMYIGDNTFVHAANSATGVVTTSLSVGYYAQRGYEIRRMI